MTARVYLDTNVFIDAFETETSFDAPGRLVLDFLSKGRVVGVISELVVAELLVKPMETGDTELQYAYACLFDSGQSIETRPVDREVLLRAAQLRAESKSLRMPDPIHVATAQLGRCGGFVTSDRRLAATPVIRTIRLDGSTVANIQALT
jgi:predicted nucleic acid-binding protein